ncbi:MAG: EF-Tu/IF-2/RF-3 family GTPase [Thermoplasmata archaeon]
MNQTILFYGNEEILASLFKKGSETDIRYYNYKIAGNEVTFLFPFKFPERIQPLVNACSVANKAVLAVEQLDKNVGEFILSLDYYEIKKLAFIGDEGMFSQLKKLVSPMGIDISLMSPRFEDFERFVSSDLSNNRKSTLVAIDQSFPVKGVGTVSLGFVLGGEIKRHMVMKSYPSGKTVDIKNIQVMDVDVESAEPFSRVGIAYRNTEVEEVPRGSILYDSDSMSFVESMRLSVRRNPTVRTAPSLGDKVQLNFLFNNINAEISDISDDLYLLDLDRKAPVLDVPYTITNLNSTPRLLGAGKPAD